MDVFTDDFSPPGTAESSPGQDYTKRDAPYGKPHDDFEPVADPQFWDKKRLGFTGDPKDQEKMDWLDNEVYQQEAPIKSPYDQFPGAVDMEDHKEETRFDVHLTDPARLKKMSKQIYKEYELETYEVGGGKWKVSVDGQELPENCASNAEAFKFGKKFIDSHGGRMSKLNSSAGPESFSKEVEKRMKKLAIEAKKPEPVKFESNFQKEKNGSPYLPEEDDKGSDSYEFGVKPVKNMP